jgi:hypothetical protein
VKIHSKLLSDRFSTPNLDSLAFLRCFYADSGVQGLLASEASSSMLYSQYSSRQHDGVLLSNVLISCE